eukprot:8863687-Pyramimonas_sp.AAC.1
MKSDMVIPSRDRAPLHQLVHESIHAGEGIHGQYISLQSFTMELRHPPIRRHTRHLIHDMRNVSKMGEYRVAIIGPVLPG